jgi:2-keto-4-pentenoate hydratase/2-oxohepta-3-ene-1,7-dioic acid hydratase in catechol pathway
MINPTDRDLHLARGKALDTFCPVGPYLIKDIDTSDLTVKTSVNGKVTLKTSTSERIWDEIKALSEISSMMTLEPGDIILTGAPASPRDSVITPGDVTTVEIENIGKIRNVVKQA